MRIAPHFGIHREGVLFKSIADIAASLQQRRREDLGQAANSGNQL
jgi:hypothetical protein